MRKVKVNSKEKERSASNIIQASEREHERDAKIAEKKSFKLLLAEVNPFDGVLSGAVCVNHHQLNAVSHYFVCEKDHHPTDRWLSFHDNTEGWSYIVQRLASSAAFRIHQVNAARKSLDIAKNILKLKMAEPTVITPGGIHVPNN